MQGTPGSGENAAVVHYSAADIEAALDRLQRAGTFDETHAAALRMELAARTSAAGKSVSERPATAVLVAAYVGVALVAAGVATLIGTNWNDLSTAARLLIFGALTLGLVVSGVMLRERLDAGRGIAWLVAVPAAGGFGAAVLGGDVDGDTRFVAGTVAAVLCALVLLGFRPRTSQMFGFVAAWTLGDVAVATRAGYDETGAGWLFVGTGVVLLTLAMVTRIPAPDLAFAMGGLVTLGGIHLLADDQLGLAVVLALVLCAVAYYRATTAEPAVPLVVATLTVASVTPRVLDGWFDDSVGASGILALTGIVVLVVVAAHVRLGRHQSMRRSSAR